MVWQARWGDVDPLQKLKDRLPKYLVEIIEFPYNVAIFYLAGIPCDIT
jgi:hypothetical protein